MNVEEKYTPAWYRKEIEGLNRSNEKLRKELKALNEPDEDQSYMVGYR